MNTAAENLLEDFLEAANSEDYARAELRLDELISLADAESGLEAATVARLKSALIELQAMSPEPRAALAAALADVEARAAGGFDPLETLLAIDALAQRLLDAGNVGAACQVQGIALDLGKALGDVGSDAHVARLRRYARMLEAAGRADQARAVLTEVADVQARYGTRERKGGFGLDVTIAPKPSMIEEDLVVDVFYATHRGPTGDANPYAYYGGTRSEKPDYGIATVSVPRQRDKGTLQFPPAGLRRAGVRSDDCFLLKRLETGVQPAVWLQRLSRQTERAPGDAEALIFVHGYSTAFWEAMLRAGQLGADLEINGAVSAYSWPSRGAKLKYDEDENQVIRRHYGLLASMIVDIARTARPKRLFLIAHSMGARFLVEALRVLNQHIADGEVSSADVAALRDIVFAAPDVDAADFKDNLVALTHIGSRITVYCSRNDDALWWGETLRHSYPRAGRQADLVADERLIAIDTTDVSGSDFGHGDYAASALSDLLALVWLDLAPETRQWLQVRSQARHRYWVYEGSYADGAKHVALQIGLLMARRYGGLQQGLAEVEKRMAIRRSPDDVSFLAAVAGELQLLADRTKASVDATM